MVGSLVRLACVFLTLSLAAHCEGASLGSLAMDLPASHHLERQDQTVMDWTTLTLYAAGYCDTDMASESLMLTAAYEDAAEQMLEALLNINITATMTVEESLAERPSLAFELHYEVLKAQVLTQCACPRDRPTAAVLLALDFSGSGLLPLLVQGRGVGLLRAHLPTPTPPPAEASAEWLAAIRHPTGVIVDASDLSPASALCPTIYADDGRLVFDQRCAGRVWFMQQGGVTYVSDLPSALASTKIGVNPYVARAVALSPQGGCDLILSEDDSDRLIFLRDRLPFFLECKVLIVAGSGHDGRKASSLAAR